MRASGRTVLQFAEADVGQIAGHPELRADLLTWHGGIGRFAALIAACDEYAGYDSAGQHIAAALGTPAIDIFTGSASPVFQERWTPAGRGVVHLVAAPSTGGGEAVLSEVMALHQTIKSKC